jgi:hypothetical protein
VAAAWFHRRDQVGNLKLVHEAEPYGLPCQARRANYHRGVATTSRVLSAPVLSRPSVQAPSSGQSGTGGRISSVRLRSASRRRLFGCDPSVELCDGRRARLDDDAPREVQQVESGSTESVTHSIPEAMTPPHPKGIARNLSCNSTDVTPPSSPPSHSR